MKTITIGIAGAGRAFRLHVDALKYVHGITVNKKTVMDTNIAQAEAMQRQYGFEKASSDFEELIGDPEIDVIHIVTPPYTHEEMTVRALEAGKNVICEKPFVGYFEEAPKSLMYEEVLKKLGRIRNVSERTGKKVFYAENVVYAPAVRRAADFIAAKKSRILFMKGEESLKGSSSPVAGYWSKTGGGTFSRNGVHPVSMMLWLKNIEAAARGVEIRPVSVLADMEMISPDLSEYEHRHIDARPADTEDIGTAIIKFSDNSRGVVMATNIYLGGFKDYVEVYCNDASYYCKTSQSDTLRTYFLDEDGIADMRLSELCDSKTGWNNADCADDLLRGYIGEMQDFMECVATGREPLSGIDLAEQATKIIYAAYLSAESGKAVKL
ncbi:MAG: Gfo/Idh/MocA family oxidoreductase [Lachnospiraceae bacterium]|nr:Gfo/Idh/MocA family oxidoreductase [Lachnospiraceae bacterium]